MSLAEKTSTLPTHKRQRDLGGENVLFCARMRAKTAKARGEVERTIDPDTAGRVPLGNALAEIGMAVSLFRTTARCRTLSPIRTSSHWMPATKG